MMKKNKDTYQNTLIVSGKSIEGEVESAFIIELKKQTRENIKVAQQDLKRKGKYGYNTFREKNNQSY